MEYLFIVVAFAFIILLNILTVNYIIRKAVKNFVIPELENKGLTFLNYKWTGLLNFGDFKNETIDIGPSVSNGNPFLSLYVYIFYKDEETEKRVTIRIDTLFLFIHRVTYSNRIA